MEKSGLFTRVKGFLARDKKQNDISADKSAATKAVIQNKGEFVAAVSAVIAEELGEDVKAIRILAVDEA